MIMVGFGDPRLNEAYDRWRLQTPPEYDEEDYDEYDEQEDYDEYDYKYDEEY